MRKWTARGALILLATVIVACLPHFTVYSLLRNRLLGRGFRQWLAHLIEDLEELAEMFAAKWRGSSEETRG